jgi:hypothetical protein
MPNSLFVAIVHTPEAVQLIAVSLDQVVVRSRLAQFVPPRPPYTLGAPDAAHVQSLLASSQEQAAVDYYFATVGRRWDSEWLVTTCVNVHDAANALVA